MGMLKKIAIKNFLDTARWKMQFFNKTDSRHDTNTESFLTPQNPRTIKSVLSSECHLSSKNIVSRNHLLSKSIDLQNSQPLKIQTIIFC